MDPYQHYGPPPAAPGRGGPSGCAVTFLASTLLVLVFGGLMLARYVLRPETLAPDTLAQATRTRTPPREPTATPIPGWTRFEGDGAQLWLPSSFRGGDLERDWPELLADVRAESGQQSEELLAALEQLMDSSAGAAMTMLDFEEAYAGTTVVVGHFEVYTSVENVKEYLLEGMNAAVEGQGAYTLVDEREVEIVGLPGHRLRLALDIEGEEVEVENLTYILQQGSSFWAISYNTGADLYAGLEPIFEQSLRTFRIVKR